jgi:CRISPR-associated protein Cas5 subtype I-B
LGSCFIKICTHRIELLQLGLTENDILNVGQTYHGLTGDFAAFRDPSVTSNQTVYYIPSKSAIIGLISAIVGIQRSNRLDNLYGKEYLDFFSVTRIGMRLESEPKKTTFFTNHRSLKETKTKPFKTELVESPKYTIFLSTDDPYYNRVKKAIENRDFAYSPYLGHAYCPARIDSLQVYQELNLVDPEEKTTSCVVLDESETYKDDFKFILHRQNDTNGRIIIERHLHHFMESGKFESRVLKHWIPVKSIFLIEKDSERSLSNFIPIEDEVVCLY